MSKLLASRPVKHWYFRFVKKHTLLVAKLDGSEVAAQELVRLAVAMGPTVWYEFLEYTNSLEDPKERLTMATLRWRKFKSEVANPPSA